MSAEVDRMAERDASDTEWDYRTKYTDRNVVARFLVSSFYRSLARLIEPVDAETALEVGCGEGFSTERLRAMLPASTMLQAGDVEARLVERASVRNPSVPVQLESVYDLPHENGAFDVVFCLEVLEHLSDPARAMAELTRVAKQWVVASVPREPLWRILNMARFHFWSELGNTPGHIQHWSRRSFVGFAGCYGTPVAIRAPIPWTQVLLQSTTGLGR